MRLCENYHILLLKDIKWNLKYFLNNFCSHIIKTEILEIENYKEQRDVYDNR